MHLSRTLLGGDCWVYDQNQDTDTDIWGAQDPVVITQMLCIKVFRASSIPVQFSVKVGSASVMRDWADRCPRNDGKVSSECRRVGDLCPWHIMTRSSCCNQVE